MKESKSTFITIVVLLTIMLPIAVYGTYNAKKDSFGSKVKEKENINKEFSFNSSLYYYNEKKELLGTYKCITSDCGKVKTIIDDDAYSINYYRLGKDNELSQINDDYALLHDGKKDKLFNLKMNKVLIEFDAIKNYSTPLSNNLIIVKDKDKWGVINVDNMKKLINYEYDFLGLINRVENDLLDSSKFVGKKNNKWFVVGLDGTLLNNGIDEEIVSYNETYIAAKGGLIYDFLGNSYLTQMEFKNTYIVDKYVVGLTKTNLLMVYSDVTRDAVGVTTVGVFKTLDLKLENKKINVYLDDVLNTSIDLL
ncbi:MAG: hypothetical protein RR478_01670 [Bacilli bacterium]